MSKIKLTKVPFKGTAEQEAQLMEKLAVLKLKNMKGGLMPALAISAQEIYGYLPHRGSKDYRRAREMDCFPRMESFSVSPHSIRSSRAQSSRQVPDFDLYGYRLLC